MRIRGKEIHTVFDLLGGKENDITFSLGWACSRSESFAECLLSKILGCTVGRIASVELQSGVSSDVKWGHGGYTDIEIQTQFHHLIIEAKRGWNLPTVKQLQKYIRRFDTKRSSTLVVMAECAERFAKDRLPASVEGIPVHYMSWKDVYHVANQCRREGNHAERRLLGEICDYLEGLMTMQNIDSNLVYVVSLGNGGPSWCSISWKEIVIGKNKYFCLFGARGWPKTPPNYLGFRFKNSLQFIRHVEGYEIARGGKEMAEIIPEIDAKKWDKTNKHAAVPHFVFSLGPEIRPGRSILTGKIWGSGRVWAALDLLLTSPTIASARDTTNERRKALLI